jgi:EmrB/QacA subfamily drug resistance transporter
MPQAQLGLRDQDRSVRTEGAPRKVSSTGPSRPSQEGGLILRSGKGRVALAATVAASAMASLDATVVNVALPHLGRDLHAGVTSLQWALTAYLLALASFILLGGALGDRLGRKKVFVVGTVWFAAASMLCGTARDIEVLIAARALQGVGAALLTPGSLAILQASFRPSDRAPAVGAWSGLGAAAGAVGPFAGGALVDGPGWRWVFFINLPVAVVAVGCARAVPESRDPNAAGGLDIRGSALAVIGLAAATWALTEAGPLGWGDRVVDVAGAGAVIAGTAFVWHLRRARGPLVPPALFANRTFTVVNAVTFLLYGALGVTFFLVSYELQVVARWSALQAGVALLPATALMLLLSVRSGALGQRIGPRWQLTVGPVLTGAGLLLLARIGPHTHWATDVLPGACIFGLGLVTFVAPLTATVMAAADPSHVSVASAVNNAVARAASLFALAAVPVVSGLATAAGNVQVTRSFRMALVIAAAVAAAAAPLAFIGLKPRLRAPRGSGR